MTEDLSACKSEQDWIRIYTDNKNLFLAPLPGTSDQDSIFIAFVNIFQFSFGFLFASTKF
jgi:hypothetical protein